MNFRQFQRGELQNIFIFSQLSQKMSKGQFASQTHKTDTYLVRNPVKH